MPRTDAAMDALIAEFRTLDAADRRAILSRLRFDERMRFEAAATRSASEAHACSPDIAALAETGGAGLTDAARAALAEALAAGPVASPPPVRPSLFDRLWRR